MSLTDEQEEIVRRKFWQRMKGLNYEHFCDAMNELHTRAYELANKHMVEAMSCHPRISASMIEAVKEKAVLIREDWDGCREVLTVESTLEKLIEEILERKYGPGVQRKNWRQATLSQLYEIGYHDEGCKLEHKQAAVKEIERRQRAKKNNMVQAKIRRRKA